jgi:hydrogenase maturation factor
VDLKPGKLEPAFLQSLLEDMNIEDDRVVIRPGIGRDVTAIDMGDRYLVAKTDPITFATDRIGWYVVQVNANDIATAGARPKWFLATALLPEGKTDEALVREIWNDLKEGLNAIGCCLCGGHTEVTVGLGRPILVGHMLGEVSRDNLVRKDEAREGDRILMTKGVPLEGTAIMARERRDLLSGSFSDDTLTRAGNFLEDPGISVVEDAMVACSIGGVHAMHDPTEGGVATGLWELAKATGLGMRAEEDKIEFLEPGMSFCRYFGADPLGMISSGTLLICAAPDDAGRIRSAIEQRGIGCWDIGVMLPPDVGVKLVRETGEEIDMPVYVKDEITKIWQ